LPLLAGLPTRLSVGNSLASPRSYGGMPPTWERVCLGDLPLVQAGYPRSIKLLLLAKPTPTLHEGRFSHCKGCAHPNEEVPVVEVVMHAGSKHSVLCSSQTLGCLTKVVQCLLEYRFYVVSQVILLRIARARAGRPRCPVPRGQTPCTLDTGRVCPSG
jgi:hypothetical protein